ncbi:hypothetical protein ACJ41O_005435 [Fusarium nematophilum]
MVTPPTTDTWTEVKAMLASADSSIYNCPPNVFQQDFWVTDQASQSQPTDNVYGFNVNTPTYDAAYGYSTTSPSSQI